MKKKTKIITAILFILWILVILIDFNQVTRNFEKPIFCIAVESADDGGSGKYVGLGYSFDIKGNFMPEDEFPGVTEYHGKLFGIFGTAAIRD